MRGKTRKACFLRPLDSDTLINIEEYSETTHEERARQGIFNFLQTENLFYAFAMAFKERGSAAIIWRALKRKKDKKETPVVVDQLSSHTQLII